MKLKMFLGLSTTLNLFCATMNYIVGNTNGVLLNGFCAIVCGIIFVDTDIN